MTPSCIGRTKGRRSMQRGESEGSREHKVADGLRKRAEGDRQRPALDTTDRGEGK